MTSRAFAPAHVSGLFAVHAEAAVPAAKGSRGAGWSLALGATATARPGTGRIRIEGAEAAAPVTRAALAQMGPGAASLDVDISLDLPVGQGFGMSAAGTLAACLAAAAETGADPEQALAATHAAEVAAGTGLGDAIGSWHGAGEVRAKPGLPPHGYAMRIEPPEHARFLCVVLGRGIATPTIVRDAAWAQRTRQLGDAAVDRILSAGRPMAWQAILLESHRFSLALGLMPDAMRAVGEALPSELAWGQAMLGHTLWVTGPSGVLDTVKPILAAHGPVLDCGVDRHGARLLRA